MAIISLINGEKAKWGMEYLNEAVELSVNGKNGNDGWMDTWEIRCGINVLKIFNAIVQKIL